MSRRTVSRNNRSVRRGRSARLRKRRRKAANGEARTSATAEASSSTWVRHGTALPDWTDLEPARNRRRSTSDDSFLESVSTLRFALSLLMLACAFTLYVGHVHATSDLLSRLREARAENRRLRLKHNRLEGKYDRRTGPSVIYERAHEMGLRASVTYGPPITVDE